MEKNKLGNSCAEKKLSIIIDDRLRISQPCHAVAEKSNFMLGVWSMFLHEGTAC